MSFLFSHIEFLFSIYLLAHRCRSVCLLNLHQSRTGIRRMGRNAWNSGLLCWRLHSDGSWGCCYDRLLPGLLQCTDGKLWCIIFGELAYYRKIEKVFHIFRFMHIYGKKVGYRITKKLFHDVNNPWHVTDKWKIMLWHLQFPTC